MGITSAMEKNLAKRAAKRTKLSCADGIKTCNELKGLFAYLCRNDPDSAEEILAEVLLNKRLFQTVTTDYEGIFCSPLDTASAKAVQILKGQFESMNALVADYASDCGDSDCQHAGIEIIIRCESTSWSLSKELGKILATAKRQQAKMEPANTDELR